MDTVIQKFRSALGGFNRQDVQAYIEETAAAHRKELAQLQERLEQAEGRTAELEAALSGAELEKSGAAAEEAKVRSSLEASTKTLSRLRGSCPRPSLSWWWPGGSWSGSRPRWAPWSPWRPATPS